MIDLSRHFTIDVEADGPCPGLYNMINFGLSWVEDPEITFLGEVRPYVYHPGIATARAVSGISYEEQMDYENSFDVMLEAQKFIYNLTGNKRAIFWSDNPVFDIGYWNFYWFLTGISENPAGFSGRRIGDLDAGRRGKFKNTQAWKKWRKAPHDHNPVNDAKGNAQALRHIIGLMENES